MDGNGRWAGKRALKRFLGHQQGAESVQYVVETASRIDVPWITLYAFSLENNLRRPKIEVTFLMKLLKSYLVSNVERMNDNNIRMGYIGRTHELPSEVQDTMRWAAARPPSNTGTTLTLALNYGSRSEIIDAARALTSSPRPTRAAVEDILAADALDASTSHHLQRALHRALPDPDLSSAPPASSASPTSFSGRSPTPRSSSPTASGPTSAASISLKPSPTTSAATAALAASAKTPTKNRHPPARLRTETEITKSCSPPRPHPPLAKPEPPANQQQPSS